MKLKEIKAKIPINKLWMEKLRVSQEYDNGVLEFLDFAFSNAPGSDKLPFPCVRCSTYKHNKDNYSTNKDNYINNKNKWR